MKRLHVIASCGLLCVLIGCNTQGKWTYPVEPQQLFKTTGRSTDLTIAVLPFREERPLRNRTATYFLSFIPLVPYGWSTYERPEAARMFNTIGKYELQLDEDLGKAAARSLDQSRLVRRSYFTLGGDTREADYVLRGTAQRTLYYGRIYTYCLGFYGPALWFVGLPAGTSENRIEFVLSLEDREGNEVWSYSFAGDASIKQGLYYNWGNDALNFAYLMQDGMNEALRDLSENIHELERQATLSSSAPIP